MMQLLKNIFSFLIHFFIFKLGIQVHKEDACPISGEYTGVIPDAEGLCAKLYSDCRNPQKMFYVVSNCLNSTEIYEGKIQSIF